MEHLNTVGVSFGPSRLLQERKEEGEKRCLYDDLKIEVTNRL